MMLNWVNEWCIGCMLDENGDGDFPCYLGGPLSHICTLCTAEASKFRYTQMIGKLRRGDTKYENLFSEIVDKVIINSYVHCHHHVLKHNVLGSR